MTNKNKTVWSGRFKSSTSKSFQRIGASINVDKRLYEQDIFASKIHTQMLIKKKIIPFLVIIHICITTLSNVLVSIPLTLYNYKITWAAFSFPLVVVTTDLTVRLLGKLIAQKTITFSYPLAIISSIIIVYFEGNPLSVAFRIGFASATAYALGIIIDIYAFQFIREKYSI